MYTLLDDTQIVEKDVSAFRAAEKLYRHRPEPPRRRRKGAPVAAPTADLGGVLDFRKPESIPQLIEDSANDSIDNFQPPIYGLATHPGFFFVPGALSRQEQCCFLRDVVGMLLEPPAATNLTAAHGPLPGLWQAAEQGLRLKSEGERQQAAKSPPAGAVQQPNSSATCCCSAAAAATAPACAGCNVQPAFDAVWAADGHGMLAVQLLRKLRWLTLGPRYDWTARAYDFHSPHHELPTYMVALGRQLFAQVQWAQQTEQTQQPQAAQQQELQACQGACGRGSGEVRQRDAVGSVLGNSFRADAALVCFYRQGDTLCGHQDDVERDITQPIVSVSLGCTAILLLGGQTRGEVPTAMFVRHGDAVVFTGPARMFFHGVPRVFDDGRDAVVAALGGSAEYAALGESVREFAESTRINISIRSVV